MSAFENRFNEIFASGRIGQPGYPSQAKIEAEHKITHLTRQLEIAREAMQDALKCTPFIHAGSEIRYDCGDPWELLRQALSQLDKGDA